MLWIPSLDKSITDRYLCPWCVYTTHICCHPHRTSIWHSSSNPSILCSCRAYNFAMSAHPNITLHNTHLCPTRSETPTLKPPFRRRLSSDCLGSLDENPDGLCLSICSDRGSTAPKDEDFGSLKPVRPTKCPAWSHTNSSKRRLCVTIWTWIWTNNAFNLVKIFRTGYCVLTNS